MRKLERKKKERRSVCFLDLANSQLDLERRICTSLFKVSIRIEIGGEEGFNEQVTRCEY